MVSRISSRASRWTPLICLGLPAIIATSCAGVISGPPSFPRPSSFPQAEEPIGPPEGPSARTLASLELTEQARLLLEKGEPDGAIRVLERAINLNPANGQNYYYLSEAWLMKENTVQATEFNRLAVIYLEGNSEWMARIVEQQKRIRKLIKGW